MGMYLWEIVEKVVPFNVPGLQDPQRELLEGTNLDHFGANLELISPLFCPFLRALRAFIIHSDPVHDSSVLRVAFGGHFGPFWGEKRGEIGL